MILILVGLIAAVILNAAYLAAAPSPTVFFYANVGVHVVLGAAAILIGAAVAVRRRPRPSWLWVLGFACAAAGVWIAAIGATRAHNAVLWLHAGLAALFVLGLAGCVEGWGAEAPDGALKRTAPLAVGMLCAAVLVPVVVRGLRSDARTAEFAIENPVRPPLSMEEENAPKSPFFPSSARTNVGGTIPSNFFMTSAACGRCHKDIYDQWRASTHHFSSFNNQWYRKSIEYMQDVVGTQPSKWCAGCHDHAVFFNGRFDRPIKEQIDTPEAQAGLACTSCHSVVHVGSSMGQGDFTIEYPPLHDLATSTNPWLERLHDTLIYLAPEPHRDTFMKPFHRGQTSEFCSTCHKVHLDVAVNGYRWFRGFNEYDNWQASGVSGEGARSFYYPPKPQQCADCHMPLVRSNDPAATNGFVRSHRFAAANTALPFVNHDPVQLKAVQDFLQDRQISVDVFGIVRTAAPPAEAERPGRSAEPALASTFAIGEESAQFGAAPLSAAAAAPVVAPLDKVSAVVRRGESVRVEVVVRTRKVGHFFPGGTVDAFDVWVEFEAVDENGRVILHSGEAADGGKGPVDPGAHFYRSLQLDAHGNPINKRNAWMTRSVAYVRLIPPGAADTVHYRLEIPRDAGKRITLRAKVNYRKFAWWNTQWAYAGVRPGVPQPETLSRSYDDGPWTFDGDTSHVSGQIKAIPDIPTTVMAKAEAYVDVAGPNEPVTDRTVTNPATRERWNDYGIGLLLQGDLKGAEAAFRNVMTSEPSYADGPVNVARARIQEGDTDGAIPLLQQALALSPRLAKAHYFLALALKARGRYDEALEHLRIAAEQYPRDRVVLDQIGRILFLERRFDEALTAFQRVLGVDPEDLQAHYNLMLCAQALGHEADAAREQALYQRFKADEAAQSITGPYRLRSAADNNERQSIHEHGAR